MKYLIGVLVSLSLIGCTCHFKDDTEFGFKTNFNLQDNNKK